jgi:hypothetical protein
MAPGALGATDKRCDMPTSLIVLLIRRSRRSQKDPR